MHSAVVSFATISVITCSSSFFSAAVSTLVSGKERSRLPPKFISARILPASISAGSTAQGQSPTMPKTSGRVVGPGVQESDDRQFEFLELVEEARMKPRAALAVHRAGQDHEHPGEPLREVAARRHGDARAGFHDHAALPANCGEQILQILFGNAGDVCGLRAVVAFERRPQFLQTVDRLLQVERAAIQYFARQPGKDRVVLAWIGGDVTGGPLRRLGEHRVDRPDLAAFGGRTDEHCRVVHPGIVRVADHRIGADIDQHLDIVVVGLGVEPGNAPIAPAIMTLAVPSMVSGENLGGLPSAR